MLGILVLTSLAFAADSPCNTPYRGVYIDCTVDDLSWRQPQYMWTREQLGEKCKKYIDKIKIDTRPSLLCHKSDPTWCMLVNYDYRCRQMTGGPLVIDGLGTPAPNEFIFRRKITVKK